MENPGSKPGSALRIMDNLRWAVRLPDAFSLEINPSRWVMRLPVLFSTCTTTYNRFLSITRGRTSIEKGESASCATNIDRRMSADNIRMAERGEEFYLRPIPGLKAVEEAVGRSTEMGKPVLFVPGIMDMDQVETVAGVIVLGHVSK